jgi:hypothetical protein
MADPLGETVKALAGIASRLAEQVALDTLGMLHGFLDATPACSSANRIEEIHEARTEEQAAGKTR